MRLDFTTVRCSRCKSTVCAVKPKIDGQQRMCESQSKIPELSEQTQPEL